MLLEELLGISNKRLKHIISGQNNLEYSSSDTDDVEEKPIDIISLDDISTDEDLMLIENDKEDIATTLGMIRTLFLSFLKTLPEMSV